MKREAGEQRQGSGRATGAVQVVQWLKKLIRIMGCYYSCWLFPSRKFQELHLLQMTGKIFCAAQKYLQRQTTSVLFYLKTSYLFWFLRLLTSRGRDCPIGSSNLVKKIKSMNIAIGTLGLMSQLEVYWTIKYRLLDINTQELQSAANKTCSPIKPPITIKRLANRHGIFTC